jgi:DNA repair exonuclease SbcCD ATPase subunit
VINLSEVIDELSEVLERRAAEKIAHVMFSVYERLHESLVLQRLEALESRLQRYSEEIRSALEGWAQRIEEQLAASRAETDARFRELAEAQRRTEEQLAASRAETDVRFRELAEAQRRTEEQLAASRAETDARFRELAEAQRRTEEQLAASRAETDVRFRELAEAQRRTEERLAMVIEEQRQMRLEMRDIRRQLGGLSQTVGYVLENEAMKHLPDLLLRDHGLHVQGRLKRQYVSDKNGQPIEVNIFGTARRDSEEVAIVGESKAQLSKNDIDRFLQRTVDALRSVYPQIFPLLVTHMISEPDVEDYARNMGVALYYSYEF